MNLPSKSVSYNESVISKFPVVLKSLQDGGLPATVLFKTVEKKMRDLSEFVSVLECLYVLGKVDIENGKVVMRDAR